MVYNKEVDDAEHGYSSTKCQKHVAEGDNMNRNNQLRKAC